MSLSATYLGFVFLEFLIQLIKLRLDTPVIFVKGSTLLIHNLDEGRPEYIDVIPEICVAQNQVTNSVDVQIHGGNILS
jgi:hypothetical protein